MNAPGVEQVERFRGLIARHLGLELDGGRIDLVRALLGRRMEATRRDAGEYLELLERGVSPAELAPLAQELTVGETYFFRHMAQLRAFAETALRADAAGGLTRVLSAGCATGEEPYSIAMIARELAPERRLSIRAVDLNAAALEKAARARYTEWSLRETPAELEGRWFRRQGRELVLADAVRGAVRFELKNLAAEDGELWAPGAYDAIFCRNVIMYFAPAAARALVARIERALVPGGCLFLGHAETLRGLSNQFHLCQAHDAFYYRRKSGAEDAQPPTEHWFEVIERASERIRALSASGEARPEPPAARWDPDRALELLQRERFGEALELLRARPPELPPSAGELLLESVLLAHGGELEAAEAACRRVLELDQLEAGAHYVLALCREGAGDRTGAAAHDQAAAYLDPSFAMPRLHLGLLARRDGARTRARRELEQALLLLQREEASRLLLFGGGFGRDALIALCRAELDACGGDP